jgi:hypothetical protein
VGVTPPKHRFETVVLTEEDDMPAHLRVSLPDRPGALASLARALADAGANVLSVTVIEREQGRAVDDLVLGWPYERPFDAVVRAVDSCDGGRLHGLRHVAERAASRDCDVLQQLVEQPHRALDTLIDALPDLVLADWCAAFDRRWSREAVHATPGCPLPLPETAGPLDRSRAITHRDESLLVVQLPASVLRLLVGRHEGPAFTRSELDHAVSLSVAAVGVARLGQGSANAGEPTPATQRLLEAAAAQHCA